MIDVPLTDLILIPLVFNLAMLSACYVYYTARRVARHVRQRSTRLYRCQLCEHVYVDARDVPLARCPRCGCQNEAMKR